ncbi:unnamed protein product [Prorocentrum cordatum]|uniref:Uncharacterized protein n=1 Tax=Prorocentrum cordatum TaxID=2364126 RepID=A0ABN9QN20_9DINO|nr:unnamed protein product [Polarella glacialis]
MSARCCLRTCSGAAPVECLVEICVAETVAPARAAQAAQLARSSTIWDVEDAPGSCSSTNGADMDAQFESVGLPCPAESNTDGRSEGTAATRSIAVQTDRREFVQLQRQLEKHS